MKFHRHIHHHSKRNPVLTSLAVFSAAVLTALLVINGATILAQARSIFLELESGSRTSVTQKSSSNASGGKYVQFSNGSDSTPAPDPEPDPDPDPTPTPQARFPGDPGAGSAYWGSSVKNNGDPSGRHESATGKSLAIRRSFFQWHHHDNPSNDWLYRTVEDDLAHNRLPWVSTKTPSWQEVANGDHDARIDQLLNKLDSYGKPIWLTFHHEPEGGGGNNFPDDPGGASAWRGMQRRVRQRMNVLGTENIAFAPILMGYTWNPSSGRTPNDWWTGNTWDFYGIDHYVKSDSGTMLNSVHDSYSSWIAANGLPIAIGEWGNVQHDSQGATEMQQYWEWGLANNIVGFCYYDTDVNGGAPLSGAVLDKFRNILKNDNRVQRINSL